MNIQFSLIHVLLGVTGSLAEFYISYYYSDLYTRQTQHWLKISVYVVYA